MTPEERAKELFEKFRGRTYSFNDQKKCALIAVDEIIAALQVFGYIGALYDSYETGEKTWTDEIHPDEFFKKVKQAIQNQTI